MKFKEAREHLKGFDQPGMRSIRSEAEQIVLAELDALREAIRKLAQSSEIAIALRGPAEIFELKDEISCARAVYERTKP